VDRDKTLNHSFFFGTATVTFIVSLYDHTSMRIPVIPVLVILCIGLLLAAGCAQTSFGTRTPVGFGTSSEDQQIIDCLKAKYGEPCRDGPPRFVEPIVATRLNERNLPVDAVTKLNKNTKNIHFWVFFDRFQPSDPVTLSMKYLPTGRVVDSVEKTPDGNCGAIRAEYLMPDGGWPPGLYEITISGRGVSATKTFEVISGATVTESLPYSPEMCPGASVGTLTATTAPGLYGTTQPSGTLQVAPTRTQGSAHPDLSMAPSAWNGCWNVNSSPCGSTQVQLKPDGTSVSGLWCGETKWLSATTVGIPLRGSWWGTSQGSNCCHSGYGRTYCDPVCQLQNKLYNPSGDAGPFEFWYGTDGRSLEGKWGYLADNLTSAGFSLHGTTTSCTNELVLEQPSGSGPTPTDTFVVVQPDR
jgi:hypothetical protein